MTPLHHLPIFAASIHAKFINLQIQFWRDESSCRAAFLQIPADALPCLPLPLPALLPTLQCIYFLVAGILLLYLLPILLLFCFWHFCIFGIVCCCWCWGEAGLLSPLLPPVFSSLPSLLPVLTDLVVEPVSLWFNMCGVREGGEWKAWPRLGSVSHLPLSLYSLCSMPHALLAANTAAHTHTLLSCFLLPCLWGFYAHLPHLFPTTLSHTILPAFLQTFDAH